MEIPQKRFYASSKKYLWICYSMGSEGRSGLPGLAVGSVAEKVVREVPCSFIAMKSDHLIEVRLEEEVTGYETALSERSGVIETRSIE